ncbi:hypothetical protein NMY22_g18210 [Coprinellus aureogranulatus]|nr:hypothetical protein NMY22_g18210 [Coprinellus aureogranulatus]
MGESRLDHIYNGPVHFTGHAQNVNAGPNYGLVNQHGSPSSAVSFPAWDSLPLTLRPIVDASHLRDRRRSPPNSSCLPGTRKEVLAKILAWATTATFVNFIQERHGGNAGAGEREEALDGGGNGPIKASEHIVWLCGPAGDGKSAISQAICEALDDPGLLLASFFFFRGSGDRSRIARLVVTLAEQMVEVIPETAPLVAAALRSTSLAGAGVATQFQRLIFRPLQTIIGHSGDALGQHYKPATRPFVIVIDGADECDDRNDVTELVEHLLKMFDNNPQIPLRILLVSRVEAHIQQLLEGEVHVEYLHRYDVHEDITLLVNHTFEVACKRDRVIKSFGYKWPSDSDVRSLIKHADNSFIFIRTLLNYVLGAETSGTDGITPMDRLQKALTIKALDSMYVRVLERSKHIPHFEEVLLAAMTFGKRLSISDMALLLGIPSYKVINVLIPLQSILYVPADDGALVSAFHASLVDLIRDEGRSGNILPLASRKRCRDRISYRTLDLVCMGHAPEGIRGWYEPMTHHRSVSHYETKRLKSGLLEKTRRQDTCGFFIQLGLQIMTRRELEILLAHFFSCPGYHGSRSADDHLYYSRLHAGSLIEGSAVEEVETKFQCAEFLCLHLDVLSDPTSDGGFSAQSVMHEMGIHLHNRPFNPHDSEIHRRVDSSYVKHWTEHLTLAIIGAGVSPADTADLSAFIQSSYPLPENSALGSFTIGSVCWPDIQLAKKSLKARFPHLLGTSNLWELAPDYSKFYKCGGPTIVDMLNATFREYLEAKRRNCYWHGCWISGESPWDAIDVRRGLLRISDGIQFDD